jgi:hypothetical protein
MKVYCGVEVQLHAFFDLGIKWRWVVNFTPRPLYPPVKEPFDRRLGGSQSHSGRGGEERNSQPLSGLEPLIIQLATHRYTTELSLDLSTMSKMKSSLCLPQPSSTPWRRTGSVEAQLHAYFDLGTRWRRAVSFTDRPPHHPGKSPCHLSDRRMGGPQSRSGHGGVEKNSKLLPGPEPPTTQPAAQRVTF